MLISYDQSKVENKDQITSTVVVKENISGEDKSYIDPSLLLSQSIVQTGKIDLPKKQNQFDIVNSYCLNVPKPQQMVKPLVQPNGLAAAIALNINPFAINEAPAKELAPYKVQSKSANGMLSISLPQSMAKEHFSSLTANANECRSSKLKLLDLSSCSNNSQKSKEEKHLFMQELKQMLKSLHPVQRQTTQTLLGGVKVHKFETIISVQDFVRDMMAALTTVNNEVSLILLKCDEMCSFFNLLSCLVPTAVMESYVNFVNQALRVVNAKKSVAFVSTMNNSRNLQEKPDFSSSNASNETDEAKATLWQPSKRAKLIVANSVNNHSLSAIPAISASH